MTQVELEREVSRATGETRGTIRHRGFSILPVPADDADDEPHLLRIVDCCHRSGYNAKRTPDTPRECRV